MLNVVSFSWEIIAACVGRERRKEKKKHKL